MADLPEDLRQALVEFVGLDYTTNIYEWYAWERARQAAHWEAQGRAWRAAINALYGEEMFEEDFLDEY